MLSTNFRVNFFTHPVYPLVVQSVQLADILQLLVSSCFEMFHVAVNL